MHQETEASQLVKSGAFLPSMAFCPLEPAPIRLGSQGEEASSQQGPLTSWSSLSLKSTWTEWPLLVMLRDVQDS